MSFESPDGTVVVLQPKGEVIPGCVRELQEVFEREIPPEGIEFLYLTAYVEQELILKACRQANWNQTRAAELLRVNRDRLRHRMKKYRISATGS